MQTIIAQPGQDAHPNPDPAARQRADQLARATADQMEAALAYLSMIDPEAFEIAFTAVAPAADEIHEDDEPIPVCRQCGGLAGIFLSRDLQWQHFRGDGITSGAQQIYDPGHAPEVAWILPDEDPDELLSAGPLTAPRPTPAGRSAWSARLSPARFRVPHPPGSADADKAGHVMVRDTGDGGRLVLSISSDAWRQFWHRRETVAVSQESAGVSATGKTEVLTRRKRRLSVTRRKGSWLASRGTASLNISVLREYGRFTQISGQ
jgi:hypothetical protein